MKIRSLILTLTAATFALTAQAQHTECSDSTHDHSAHAHEAEHSECTDPNHDHSAHAAHMDEHRHDLHEVTVRSRGRIRRSSGPENSLTMTRTEIFRHACCNLGESFVTNPAVDVTYSDAATGAKQIKLLGLSGTYVQMLSEGLPDFRGAAMPYALDYVPGAWMNSIQISKGSASVKNGYESLTGQISIDYLRPGKKPAVELNAYLNSMLRYEANAAFSSPLKNKHWSTAVLAHYEDEPMKHDGNDDNFEDKPRVRQYNVMNRWNYEGHGIFFHAGWSALGEERKSGEDHVSKPEFGRYGINVENHRYNAYTKATFVLDHEHNGSLALLASGTMHRQNARFGMKGYDVDEKNAYASLVYEMDITPQHLLSMGVSYNYDDLGQNIKDSLVINNNTPFDINVWQKWKQREHTPGIYAQYTFNLSHDFSLLAGLRYDYSSIYGSFVTPRAHIKWMPHKTLSLRLSGGKGYRTPFALAENANLMASGRELIIENLKQEEAWNTGLSAAWTFPIGKNEKMLRINAEYYYTHFLEQAVIDYDADPTKILIRNLNGGKSRSHTFQIDASYPFFKGFEATAAFRMTDVRTTYNGVLRERPLTSKYKGLVTLSYKTPKEKWKADATLQINGGGRLPENFSGKTRYDAFPQLSLQVTREFKHCSLYVGGENLTNFKVSNPIIAADAPWSRDFEPTLVWGPVQGAMAYAGIRVKL